MFSPTVDVRMATSESVVSGPMLSTFALSVSASARMASRSSTRPMSWSNRLGYGRVTVGLRYTGRTNVCRSFSSQLSRARRRSCSLAVFSVKEAGAFARNSSTGTNSIVSSPDLQHAYSNPVYVHEVTETRYIV